MQACNAVLHLIACHISFTAAVVCVCVCVLVSAHTTDTRGRLVKATRLKGIQDFKASGYGLHPIAVDTWGHFVFLHLQGGAGRAAAQAPAAAAAPSPPSVAEWLGMCQILHCIRLNYHTCLSSPEWYSITPSNAR